MRQQTAPEGPAADALEGRGPSPIATRPRALVARQNATKSTGPRTLTGKARSARNATKHGLTARAVLDPAGVEVLVYDVAERADPGASVEALDGVAPDWRTRRWTGREELERTLARAFGNEELVGMARVLAMLRADAARRRLEDAEKRHARYVAERQVPTVNAELLERYETHLQRQLASTLTMLRDVRETFTSTG